MTYRRPLEQMPPIEIEKEVQQVIQDHQCQASGPFRQTRCGISAGTVEVLKTPYSNTVTMRIELFGSQGFTVSTTPVTDETPQSIMTDSLTRKFAFPEKQGIDRILTKIGEFVGDICLYYRDELPEFGDHHIVELDTSLRCSHCQTEYDIRQTDERIGRLDAYGYFLETTCE